MKHKKKILIICTILVILVLVPISFVYVLNNGNPLTHYIADKKVPLHLEENGYTTNDLKESTYIEPKHTINRKFFHGHYKVVFEDEPTVTYYYGVTKLGNAVQQFCEKDQRSFAGVTDTVTDDLRHSEKECASYQ